MAESEDPELTSSHGHTKITAIYRAAIDGKDLNLPEMFFYNERYKEGTTQDRSEGWSCSAVKTQAGDL